MQWNSVSPPELCSDIIKSTSLGFWEAKHRIDECYQGHAHEDEVDIGPTQFLQWRTQIHATG